MVALQRQSLVKGALMVTASKGTARLLRFLLLMYIPFKFGMTSDTDAYFIVQSITLLFLTVNDTIFNYSLIPVLMDERVKHGDDQARELASSAFAYVNQFFCLVSLLLYIFASPIARFMGPDLAPESQELAAVLVRIVSPIPLLAGLGGLAASIFYSHRNFTLPNITFVFYGMSSIISVVLFADVLGIPSIPCGAAFGVLLQAVVLITVLVRMGGLKLTFRRHPRLKDVLLLTGPRILGRVLADLNVVVDKMLATGLGVGAVTALSIAFRLNQFTFAMLINPLGIAMPAIAEKASLEDFQKLRDLAVRILGLITFLVLPWMAGVFALRVELIAVLWERGEFTRADTLVTASAFFYFNIGALFVAMDILLLGAFYALREARIPMYISVLTFVLNVVLDLVLMRVMGLDGIALAKSVIATINIVILFWLIQKRIGVIDWGRYLKGSFVKIAAAAAAAGAAAHAAVVWGPRVLGIGLIPATVSAVLAGGCVYLGACFLLKVREVKEVRTLLSMKRKGREGRAS